MWVQHSIALWALTAAEGAVASKAVANVDWHGREGPLASVSFTRSACISTLMMRAGKMTVWRHL